MLHCSLDQTALMKHNPTCQHDTQACQACKEDETQGISSWDHMSTIQMIGWWYGMAEPFSRLATVSTTDQLIFLDHTTLVDHHEHTLTLCGPTDMQKSHLDLPQHWRLPSRQHICSSGNGYRCASGFPEIPPQPDAASSATGAV